LINENSQSLFQDHPKVRRVWTWGKSKAKYKKLRSLIGQVRQERFDLIINCHRFASSGVLTALSKAKVKLGFDKNPFSFTYTYRMPHRMEEGIHEVDRNLSLLTPILQKEMDLTQHRRPVLYPSVEDEAWVKPYQQQAYICIAPTSVWFTKQFPQDRWVTFINTIHFDGSIFLLGGKDDIAICENIAQQSNKPVTNLAGKLTLLQSAVLMQQAVLNYVNDSAPLHLASAVNAPVCAVYCSTVTDFGFYPLSDFAKVVQKQEELYCRPCGLHGHEACPEGHFKCAYDITVRQLLEVWQNAVQYRADKKIS
jgi:heptosyltransferase-2